MTVASINSTVTTIVAAQLGQSVADQYSGAITAITRALEAREHNIVDAVAETANENYGVSKREVATILHGAGLSERPAPVAVPVPVAVPFGEDATPDEAVAAKDGKLSKGERIAKLEEGQANIAKLLTELSGSVRSLSELAEKHLGASL